MLKKFFSKYNRKTKNTKEIIYYSIDKKKYVKTRVPENVSVLYQPQLYQPQLYQQQIQQQRNSNTDIEQSEIKKQRNSNIDESEIVQTEVEIEQSEVDQELDQDILNDIYYYYYLTNNVSNRSSLYSLI